MSRSSLIRILLIVVAFLSANIILVIGFVTEPLGWAWHSINGDTLHVNGWTVSVPPDWFVIKRSNAVYMAKLPPVLLGSRGRGAHVSVLSGLPTDTQLYSSETAKKWSDQVETRLNNSGYYSVGVKRYSSMRGLTICVQGLKNEGHLRRQAECFVAGGRLFLVFDGSDELTPDFNLILLTLKEAP